MPTPALLRELERALPERLDAAALAELNHSSHSQLYREFYSLTGHTVGEYIRKRRLSNALALIKTSRLPLIDVAQQCGFSSQQALNRAVRQAMGMTPLAYKNSDACYFFPPYAGQALFPVSVKPERIPAALCLRFYHPRYRGIEDRALEQFFTLAPDYRGRLFGRNGKQRGVNSCYELYVTDYERLPPLKNSAFEPGEVRPAISALFATTAAPNEEARINAAWDYLCLAWLAGSMFERAEQPYFEEYVMKRNECAKLRLYLPIQKRADCANITLEQNPALHFVTATAKTEKAASRAAVSAFPQAAREAREFYVRQDAEGCTCGLGVSAPSDGRALTPPPGRYLVLHSRVMGEYDALRGLLLAFAEGNGMLAQREGCFAVYDARGGYENPGMRVYCPVNFA